MLYWSQTHENNEIVMEGWGWELWSGSKRQLRKTHHCTIIWEKENADSVNNNSKDLESKDVIMSCTTQ